MQGGNVNNEEIDNKLSKLSELEIKLLYYCKMPKTLRDIERTFGKDYWYINHLINDLHYDGLINKDKKHRDRTKLFNTLLDVAIRVEEEMKKRGI